MIELYYKGRNKLLDCIDSAKTNTTKNERKRLQKRIESLLWEVSKDAFLRGYEARRFEEQVQNENSMHGR
jgi:Txe/YoeB family toxin of Txe-Axe toxin-antitoxin module